MLEGLQTYNLNNLDSIGGTTPDSFIFYGENVSVKNYSNMLSEVIRILYELDPRMLEDLAKNKLKVTSSNCIYLSTDKSDMRRSREIGDSGIYYEVNLSASSVLSFIKALIEKYEMDTDEFEFVCK